MRRRNRLRRAALGLPLLLLLGGAGAPEPGALPAGPAILVHDFFLGESEGDRPAPQLTRLGQALFFLADDRESGLRLWRTDGTPGGSFQVSAPGFAGTLDGPQIVGAIGPRLVWSAYDATDFTRRVLLAADEQGIATALGSYGTFVSEDEKVTLLASRFFYQDCTYTECRIDATDGTAAGTGPVPALAGFTGTGTDQILLAAFADRWLVFRAGSAVYAYDATTGEVRTLLPAAGAVRAYGVGASLYLEDISRVKQDFRLWVARLDAPQPALLFEGAGLGIAGWQGDTFYFVDADGVLQSTDGRSLRRYAGKRLETFNVLAEQLGTIGSTAILTLPGYYSKGLYAIDDDRSEVRELRQVCGFPRQCENFSLSDVAVAGREAFLTINWRLWRSDGTAPGTGPHPSLGEADADTFRVFDDRLVLGATSKAGEQRLWATDGGAAGTEALSDAGLPFRLHGPAERLGDALFAAGSRKPVGQQLWRIADGRAVAITALKHPAAGFYPTSAFRLGHAWVLLGGAARGGQWLAPSGATGPLPIPMTDCESLVNPCPDGAVTLGGHPERLVYTSFYYSPRLAVTDGSAAGTRTLPLEDPDGVPSAVSSLGRFQDRALVIGDAGGLWATDGTPGGTRFVVRLPIPPAPASPGRGVGAPVAVGSLSFLFRRVPVPGDPKQSSLELWRTDGTAAGTLRLASIPFDSQSDPYPNPTPFGRRLFFRAFGVLWVSDGSLAGTRPFPRQPPGGTFALMAGASRLYVGAGYLAPQQPKTLWSIDPGSLAATRLGSFPTLGYDTPGFPLGNLVGDTLFFGATDEAGRFAWWRTEGTAASTVLLPEPLASILDASFVTLGDRRYFRACDAEHGCELWSTDRLGEDTRLVQDLWAGPRGSDPEILGADERSLWFAATEPSVGNELWRLDLSAGGAGARPTSPLLSRPTARARAVQARRALEPRWRRMLR